MPSEKNNKSEFYQYMKSDKMLYIIYADMKSLIKKINQNSSTAKIGEPIPCGYSISPIWAFYHIENKDTLYHGKYCMKKFCSFLRQCTKNKIDFEKKNMLPLTQEELKSHQDAKLHFRNLRIFKKVL